MKLPRHVHVFYHYIRDESAYNVHAIKVAELEAQIDWLLEKYQPLDPDELTGALSNGENPASGFMLSFDDGFKEHYEIVFPLLKRKGLRAFFFPNVLHLKSQHVPLVNQLQVLVGEMKIEQLSECIIQRLSEMFPKWSFDRVPDSPKPIKRLDDQRINNLKYFLNFTLPSEVSLHVVSEIFRSQICHHEDFIDEMFLNAKEMKEMSDAGMVFGGHSLTHPYMTRLDRDGKKTEISQSISFLDDLLSKKTETFCYPFGHADPECREVLEELDVKLAFTTSPEDNYTPENKHRLARFDTVLLPPISKFSLNDLKKID